MYSFVDVTDKPKNNGGLYFNFNNKDFKALTITGRDIVNNSVRSQEIRGRSGSYFLDKSFTSRDIKIKILVEADTNKNYRLKFEELNRILNTEKPAPLTFSDEPDRVYYGLFVNAETPEEIKNLAVVVLNFVCYDPFKYSNVKFSTGTVIDYVGDFPSYPKVTITLTSPVDEIRLLHVESQKYIRLRGSYLQGNRVVVDMLNRSVTVNGRNDLAKFDMVNSRFFTLNNGRNTLNISNNHNIAVEYKEVYL